MIYPGCFPPGLDPVSDFEQAYGRAVKRLVPSFVAMPENKTMASLVEFLSTVSTLNEDAALFGLYNHVDTMLRAGDFEGVDRMLADAPTADVPLVILLGLLSITSSAPSAARADFAAKVRARLTRDETSERVESLMRGLE